MSFLFTSESVSLGHPDKVADQISDFLLDYFIENYNQPKVAIEVMIARNKIVIGGEVSVEFNEEKLRDIIKKFILETNLVPYMVKDFESLEVIFLLDMQSSEINQMVIHEDDSIGAGDQGIMYGYANNDTPNYMPAPIYYAKKILNNILINCPNLGPDAKSQVAVEYNDYHEPIAIHKILVSVQHPENINYQDLKETVLPYIYAVIPNKLISQNMIIMVNPAGSFISGGPFADTGLTGRKIIVDTYGGFAPHGGGAFSGKDPTKVDRSAGYMARYLAKNIVAAGLADEVIVQIAYTIGIEKPFSFSLNTKETGFFDDNILEQIISNIIDLSPKGIINYLNLWQPIYYLTAKHGHFESSELPWEQLTLVSKLESYIKNDFTDCIFLPKEMNIKKEFEKIDFSDMQS